MKSNSITQQISSAVGLSEQLIIQGFPDRARAPNMNDPITVVSANLWHDWPWYRNIHERLECFVNLVKAERVDVILLQEVVRTKNFLADEWLNERLNMAYAYSRANGNARGIGFEEGVAIFSRYPVSGLNIKMLSDSQNPFVKRVALGTSIQTRWGDIAAFTIHLGINGRQNRKQFWRLYKWVEDLSGEKSVMIGGDFNAREHTSQIQYAQRYWQDTYRYINPDSDGFTHEIRWPWGGVMHKSRLDYVFLRQGNTRLRVIEARHVNIGDCKISDHKPVLIKLSNN